jgi:SAM-dependent methyltransferase
MADPPRERAVAAYYDRLALVYGEGDYARARRTAVLRLIATEIDRAQAVLDLGCGNGAYALAFAARPTIGFLVAADLSAVMLQSARRRLGERAALVRADATALPFRATRFDLVFMSHVLLLVSDIDRCVAEVARSLAPGGVLIATVGASGWRDTLQRLFGAEAAQVVEGLCAPRARLPTLGDDETRAAAAAAGVGLQPEWRRAPFTVTWPAVEEWVRLRWLTGLDEASRALAESQLERVRSCASDLTLEVTETLLLAHKPVVVA